MKIFDPHVHMTSRTTDDYEAMAAAGVVVVVEPALTPNEFAALRSATLQDVVQALTPDKVNRYVLSFFNGHSSIHVSDLPPDLLEDLQRLTTIIAYGHHPDVKYGVAAVNGEPLEIGPYLVKPFQLERIA